ncbi:MAG: hypothetical protein R2712_03095 [Vicinamibacterales bacterium]
MSTQNTEPESSTRPSGDPGIFIAVSRGRAAAVLSEDGEWTVRGFPAGDRKVDVTFRTAYEDKGFEAKVPRWLFAEVKGPAESLEDAIRRFPNAARALTPIFDVALNAAVEDLELHFAFDATLERTERAFFQNFLPDGQPTLRQTRPVKAPLLSALTDSIGRSPDSVRLHRAAAHYQQALRFWGLGDETRAVGQLWMGVEALTPVAKRAQFEKTGTSKSAELAEALGVTLKELDSTLRRRLILGDDQHCYKTVTDVSNGFEHGYMPLDALRTLAREVRDPAATYLRRAILDLSNVPTAPRNEMLASPYDSPLIGFPLTKYLRGTISGSGDLAAPGQRYPLVEWRTDIRSLRKTDDGRHDVQWNEKITPKMGPQMQMTKISIELWSADKHTGTRATMKRADVEREGAVHEVTGALQLDGRPDGAPPDLDAEDQ